MSASIDPLSKEINLLQECIQSAINQLKSIYVRKRKRPRMDVEEFKDKIKQLKAKWRSTTGRVFQLMSESSVLGLGSEPKILQKITEEIMKALHAARLRYEVDDEYYRMIYWLMLTPIIASIMDEREFSKAAKDQQKMRKFFITQLLRAVQFIDIPSSEPALAASSNENGDEDIEVDVENDDVCSSPQFQECISWEEVTVLEFLIDALSRHSERVTGKDIEFSAYIYHITNICHVIDILREYFDDNKMRFAQGMSRSNDVKNLNRTRFEKLEESMCRNLEKFDIDTPMGVYRQDLRKLLIQIRLVLQ